MIASLHLFGVRPARVPAALARMALDRRVLRSTSGLGFWKLLGTGDGRTFDVRDADPLRWGLLAVWRSPADLAAFERGSPVAAAWRSIAAERWRADLRPLRARGRWSGRTPFTAAPERDAQRWSGPVAAITRARLHPARTHRFRAAVPPVVTALRGAPGLRYSVGIGEAPFGLQGTFSVWDDADALTAFAYRQPAHRAVVDRTPRAGWYAEELFARFALVQSTGTVRGRDPAAPAPAREPAHA